MQIFRVVLQSFKYIKAGKTLKTSKSNFIIYMNNIA